jgi:hypothetical protein
VVEKIGGKPILGPDDAEAWLAGIPYAPVLEIVPMAVAQLANEFMLERELPVAFYNYVDDAVVITEVMRIALNSTPEEGWNALITEALAHEAVHRALFLSVNKEACFVLDHKSVQKFILEEGET